MTENEISKVIVDAAIEVHRVFGGPGLLEDIYEEAMEEESFACAECSLNASFPCA